MIVIVVGMHRSGTSALAGMLHHNGIVMGERFSPGPARENPKGFYENREFRNINDRLLALRGYSVKSFSPRILLKDQEPDYKIRKTMKPLISTYASRYKNWGWKDPRTCLTIGKWMNVIHNMGMKGGLKIINTRRAEEEIAFSMMARGNDGDEEQFIKLAKTYQRHFENSVGSFQYLSINFNDLIHNTEDTAEMISQYLDFEIKDISFIDPELANRKWT